MFFPVKHQSLLCTIFDAEIGQASLGKPFYDKVNPLEISTNIIRTD